MYLVVETDRYGTLEVAAFETVEEAESLIKKLSFGLPHKYAVVVKSQFVCTS